MPFIPPVSIARSVSGLTAKEKPTNASSVTAAARTQQEDKNGSVKERLTLNLKQLGKRNQSRSLLPTAKGDRLLPLSHSDSLAAFSSGESFSTTQQHKYVSSGKTGPEMKMQHQEEAHFTLMLTPEAVLLLQKKNSERHQRLAAKNAGCGGDLSGSTSDSRRRRENLPKRHQQATRHNTRSSRAPKTYSGAELGDVRSFLKVSLLNEQYKYDDVEYEEEDYGVDERVMQKCTEWLSGLENTPVTARSIMNKTTNNMTKGQIK